MTVTVGIPAYNEEGNIISLISCLLKQKQTSFKLKKIIIADDCSTDKTVAILRKIRNPLVKVISNKNRKGKPYRTDQIISYTKSDILVILDADTFIKDKNFLNKLIRPIILKKADLTSASIKELKPVTLMQKILAASMEFKKNIFEEYKNGNNIYTCHGRARAFSKKLYNSIQFENVIVDDAFSYLYCKSNKFNYYFARNSRIYYKLPLNFSEHQRQSARYFFSKEDMKKKFTKKFIDDEYYLPISLILKSFIKTCFKDLFIVVYLPIALASKFKSLFCRRAKAAWHTASSTKKLLWINQN